MTKVIAMAAQKGGVGKTTTALYVADYLAKRLGPGRVAIIDRDPTVKSLTRSLEKWPQILPPGVTLWTSPIPELDPKHPVLLPPPGQFAVTIIDTPPGEEALRALTHVEAILVPVQPEAMAMSSLEYYLIELYHQQVTIRPELNLLALVPNRVKRRETDHQDFVAAVERLGQQHRPPIPVLAPVWERKAIRTYNYRRTEFAHVAEEVSKYVLTAQPTLG